MARRSMTPIAFCFPGKIVRPIKIKLVELTGHVNHFKSFATVADKEIRFAFQNVARFEMKGKTSKKAFQSVVFNTCQKMALRAFYFIRTLTKALSYYYINRSQRHLLVAIENNQFGEPALNTHTS